MVKCIFFYFIQYFYKVPTVYRTVSQWTWSCQWDHSCLECSWSWVQAPAGHFTTQHRLMLKMETLCQFAYSQHTQNMCALPEYGSSSPLSPHTLLLCGTAAEHCGPLMNLEHVPSIIVISINNIIECCLLFIFSCVVFIQALTFLKIDLPRLKKYCTPNTKMVLLHDLFVKTEHRRLSCHICSN